MGKRPGMHHGGAVVGRAPDRSRIQQVMAVDAVITDDIVAQALQMSRYRGTYVTAMPRDQNPHDPYDRRPADGRANGFRSQERAAQRGTPPIANRLDRSPRHGSDRKPA